MIKLSAAIIVFNEERNIARCLDSLQGLADEIIIVDSQSTDKTIEIANNYQVKIHQQEFLGYAAQKNLANSLCSYEYIISLDADEVISEKLKQEILLLKTNFAADAYELNRLTNYAGKWVHHCGWYPDRKIRIFKKELAKWGGPRLHETLEINSTNIKRLNSDLLHYSFHSEEDHLKQIEKFTNISSKELFDKGKRATIYHLYIKPFIRFITDYIIKLGVLDGATGYTVCKNSAYAAYLKYSKLQKHWIEYESRSS
jgi:glycosyltransferase involved in cell wall biosynthesis